MKMLKIRLRMKMVLLLLIGLNSWLIANDNTISSTGGLQYASTANTADTTIVEMPLSYIKKANIKLTERIYLINVVHAQDSIIKLKDKYIDKQSVIINDFQDKLYNAKEVNDRINKSLNAQKRKTKIISGITSAAIIGVIIGIIIK